MLKFNAKEFDFGNKAVTKIIVVGHFAYVAWQEGEGAWLNLKDLNGCMIYADSLGISEAINHLLDSILPTVGNWGDDEKDYELALASEEWQLRALVAMNGKFSEVLVVDEHYMPRKSVVTSFINAKLAGEEIGETNFLDILVHDSSEAVRFELAVLGLTEHSYTLIHDSSEKVAQEVITKANSELLDEILDSDRISSKVSFAYNKNATEAQLATLSLEESEEVQLAVANNAHFYNLCQSPYVSVRKALATNSKPLQIKILAHDEDESVRVIVAKRGVAHETLLNDPSAKVRLAVASFTGAN